MRILVVDIGGTHVKVLATGHKKLVETPSGPRMTPAKMVATERAATGNWKYDAVSIGYPGPGQAFPEIKVLRTVPGVGPIGACRSSFIARSRVLTRAAFSEAFQV